MALTSGSAGGIPGLTLLGWAVVSSVGALLKSSGVASSARGSAGSYTVTLAVAPGVSTVTQVFFAGGGDVPPRVYAGGSPTAAQPVSFLDANGNGQDRTFYVGFYG